MVVVACVVLGAGVVVAFAAMVVAFGGNVAGACVVKFCGTMVAAVVVFCSAWVVVNGA